MGSNVLPPGSTLTYPATSTPLQDAIGLTVLPSGVAIPDRVLDASKSYGLVVVTSSDSCGLLICCGEATYVHLFQTSDQNGCPIFWSGIYNGSAAGWYASLGSYADWVHQLGWYGDNSGGKNTHGYSYINRWGSAPFDVGAAAAFHGNPVAIRPLQAPTLMAMPSTARVYTLSPADTGTFTLTVGDEQTAPISAGTEPADVQTIVQGLPGMSEITVGNPEIGEACWPALVTIPAGLGEITPSPGTRIAETTRLQCGTTYYYVATAVALDETETVSGEQLTYTPTETNPSVELVVTQDWGMSYAKIYRSTNDGGPYSLIGTLRPLNPKIYGPGCVGFGFVDDGLDPRTSVPGPQEAPEPTPTVWQAWSGEPAHNVKLQGQDFSGSSQWSITAGGTFTGSNVGSALKTTPLYNQTHKMTPSTRAGEQGQRVRFSPSADFSCIFPFGSSGIVGESSRMGAESLTVELKANYSDSTSRSETIIFTGDAISAIGAMEFTRLIKHGVTITGFNVSVASSIDDSKASVSLTIVGTHGL
jgi:hypothetical protein